ncbi:hypothetical protein ABIF63_006134 [Bradyrhizobium japonicum]|uniref:Sialate O-acetylesterase domain-containing protein n=1 Tax=Bradyrhizobium japonicum TaxID=375 RepID=A0ABV2RYL3_BRAJP
MYTSNGLDQRIVDLNVRPSVRGADATTLSGKTQVAPSALAGAVHLIFAGQSTNSCCVNSNYAGSTTNIFNLSVAHKGAVFNAADPLLSCDITQGHHGLYLARSLIDGGYASKVLITLACFGGSYAADHCPGGGAVGGVFAGTSTGDIAYRIGLTARCIANAGLSGLKTIIDWQQGEWDSDNTSTTQANYTAALNGVIAEYKRVGLLKTGSVMFINKCTRITETTTNRNNIRNGQAAVVDAGLVRAGGDIDTLGSSYRYDGTHFTASGAAAQAALKLSGMSNFIQTG